MSFAVLSIARNEFWRVLRNPIIIVVGFILFILLFINAAGGVRSLILSSIGTGWDGFLVGFWNVWCYTCYACVIMSAFLGMIATSEERFKGSFDVLLSKPVLRRDVILGKFLGLTGFTFVFITMAMFLNAILLLNYYGNPLSLSNAIVRIAAYIIVLTMYMALVIALTMLIGILTRDILTAAALVATYLSFDWFWNFDVGRVSQLLHIQIAPSALLENILFGPGGTNNLFIALDFIGWLSSASFSILAMILAILAVLTTDCLLFTRNDDI